VERQVAADLNASTEHRLIVGLGVTGLSCARHFYQRGVHFSIVDTRKNPPGLEQVEKEMPDVRVYTGGVPDAILSHASELIVSPGVALSEPLVMQAQAAGIPVSGDIDVFMEEASAPVVGITGSNAKSTVTELVGKMAQNAGLNVGVGGNLGTPALELLSGERELYVLELSSFQLERAGELGLGVATVLNISADHLDRHSGMPAYHLAKHRIFRGCKKAVVHRDDQLTLPLVPPTVDVISWGMGEPKLEGFGLRKEGGQECLVHGFDTLMPVGDLAMTGRHNIANALAALALGHSVGIDRDVMLKTLAEFQGLAHRCEFVAEIDGVRFIDDSKGTNVGATQAALSGLGGDRNIVLIAGGQGKGADFSTLKAAVDKHCRALVFIGEDACVMHDALTSVVPGALASSLHEAVASASDLAERGDTVLLSPACASFDMFSGYVERGEVFKDAVAQLQGARA